LRERLRDVIILIPCRKTKTLLPVIHKKLRKDKLKGGKCPVILQIYYNGQRKQIFTGLTIEEENWDEEKQQAKSKFRDVDHFNRMLKNKLEATEKEYYKQSALTGEVDIHTKTKQSRQNFYDYAYSYYESLINRAGLHYINKCKAAIRDFRDFSGNLSFQGITPQVLKEFEDHLFKLGRARNTINFVTKKIKQAFSQAIKEKITDHNPFILYKPITYKQVKREFLTIEEIEKLEKADFGKLNYIRDYFCLSCRTGLRFGDAKLFDKKKHIIHTNGIERIILGTEKTGEIVTVKVQPQVKKLLERINQPLPSNKHTNQLLKVIGELAGLPLPLHYHLSRHSFCTHCASLGMPIEAVGKLVGHRNIKTTAIYYKLIDKKMDDYMDLWDK
jgi:integrase/recombinase XerD